MAEFLMENMIWAVFLLKILQLSSSNGILDRTYEGQDDENLHPAHLGRISQVLLQDILLFK